MNYFKPITVAVLLTVSGCSRLYPKGIDHWVEDGRDVYADNTNTSARVKITLNGKKLEEICTSPMPNDEPTNCTTIVYTPEQASHLFPSRRKAYAGTPVADKLQKDAEEIVANYGKRKAGL